MASCFKVSSGHRAVQRARTCRPMATIASGYRSAVNVQASRHECASEAPTTSSAARRLFLAALAGSAALVPAPALAFGKGFPGYDVNVEGQKRAADRARKELQAEQERAAAYRAKIAAEKAKQAQQ